MRGLGAILIIEWLGVQPSLCPSFPLGLFLWLTIAETCVGGDNLILRLLIQQDLLCNGNYLYYPINYNKNSPHGVYPASCVPVLVSSRKSFFKGEGYC